MRSLLFAVSLLAACNATPSSSDVARIAALTPDNANGTTVYDDHCAVCHGATGGGGTGVKLASSAYALDTVIGAVFDGKESMPAFSASLTDQEIADVAAYVTEDL
jgi:mono/diheme cytochrome c family protein